MSTHTDVIRRSIFLSPISGPALHVERYGEDPPACVLIHGIGDGAFIWRRFASKLASRFATIALDLRGHGESGRDPNSRYTIGDYVGDVACVIDHWAPERVVLIGHSLGAHLAIRLYEQYTTRVAASILVDFGPDLDTESRAHTMNLLQQSLHPYSSVEGYLDWLRATRPLANPELLQYIAACALRKESDDFVLKLDPAVVDQFPETSAKQRELLWRILERQQCPTLVVRGHGSALLSRVTATRMVDTLPRGECTTVAVAGHAVMIDNPDAFEHATLTFLDRVL